MNISQPPPLVLGPLPHATYQTQSQGTGTHQSTFVLSSLWIRGLQRDVVYLGWPIAIAPSYMSPNSWGGGEVAGSQPMRRAVHRSPNKLWWPISIFKLCCEKLFWFCFLNPVSFWHSFCFSVIGPLHHQQPSHQVRLQTFCLLPMASSLL